MTKDIAPFQKTTPEQFPALAERVDGLLQLWTDLNRMPTDDLARVHAAGVEAVAESWHEWIQTDLVEKADRKEIFTAITSLIGSFPQSKEADLTVFGANLITDVIAAAPSRMALESAFVHLRRTRDYLPTIKLVLEALAEKQAACDSRAELLQKLPARVALAADVLKARAGG